MAPDRITLSNMAFFAYHGTVPGEREGGQRFFVDVDLFLDLRSAGTTDDLGRTVDYEGVYALIKDNCESKRFYLIEALAEHVARSILEKFPIERVVVRVRKPSVPVRGILDFTEVEIERSRARTGRARRAPRA